MSSSHRLSFGSFALDLADERLWRGDEEVELRPKSMAVLRHLVEHGGQLITKRELLEKIWADTSVSDTVLKVCIREIREVLGEDVKNPRYIETIPRRGYRFISDVSTQAMPRGDQPPGSEDDPFATVVGRAPEIAQLSTWLADAESGERRIVFVTGEPGIGKTTLVDLFLERAEVLDRMRVTRGQCLERYGEGEAYLPVLQAIGRLCRDPGGDRLVELLRQYAPTWLVQMPALIKDDEFEALQRKVHGTTHERMLREITEAVEAFTAGRGLVLVLEDLQWSDYSTLEFISYLAHRRERARLLVVATYRPAEVAQKNHPLLGIKRELHAHGQCEELQVSPLTAPEVNEYVTRRLQGRPPPSELSPVIHRRSEGNALFMVNLLDFAVAEGLVRPGHSTSEANAAAAELENTVPDNLRQMIQKQIEGLGPDIRPILEVASVAGLTFTAAGVAAGLRIKAEAVETQCDALARRRHLLRSCDVEQWPDGTVSASYRFIHGFYQHVLYEQMGEARRVRMHRLIGKRKEAGYGAQADSIATELAIHFECGRDYSQAVRYYRVAGENALRRRSHREASDLIAHGVQLLRELPESPERNDQELHLQSALSRAFTPIKGPASPEVEQANARAWELCQQVGETPQLFAVMLSLSSAYQVQGKLRQAQKLAEQLFQLAQNVNDPPFILAARVGLGNILFWRGELTAAREHFEAGLTMSDAEHCGTISLLYAFNARVRCLSTLSLLLCLQGFADQSLVRATEAIALAEQESSTFDLCSARVFAALTRQCRREPEGASAEAAASMAISREQGFPLFEAAGSFLQGWALVETGEGEAGVTRMRAELDAWEQPAARLLHPYFFALLAEAYLKRGDAAAGVQVVDAALGYIENDDSRASLAELYRLKGELMLLAESDGPTQGAARAKTRKRAESAGGQAEECFREALETAQRQQARTFELRAAMSMSRLWQTRGKKADARRVLEPIYGWFTEGFDTADLRDAKALLDELA
jgi:DNA-binding winged helix-turn-helix (wHTH) protein/predicted ATPase